MVFRQKAERGSLGHLPDFSPRIWIIQPGHVFVVTVARTEPEAPQFQGWEVP